MWDSLGESEETSGRRREFCEHYEGYGSVCECSPDTAPIADLNGGKTVLNNQVGFREIKPPNLSSNRFGQGIDFSRPATE